MMMYLAAAVGDGPSQAAATRLARTRWFREGRAILRRPSLRKSAWPGEREGPRGTRHPGPVVCPGRATSWPVAADVVVGTVLVTFNMDSSRSKQRDATDSNALPARKQVDDVPAAWGRPGRWGRMGWRRTWGVVAPAWDQGGVKVPVLYALG